MKPFRGIFGILAAPYNEDGSLRPEDIRREVDFCVQCGAHGLVVPVMASEFFLLTEGERKLFLKTAAEQNSGRLPLIAGVSGTSTFEAVQFAAFAREVGADAVIALPPYMLHFAGPELHEYFSRVAAAADGLPVFLQNLTAPIGTPIAPEQCIELVKKIDSVKYVKEETQFSGHTIPRILKLAEELPEGSFCGVMGGKGCKYMPDEHERGTCGGMPACEWVDLLAQAWDLFDAGKREEGIELFYKIAPLIDYELQYGASVYKEILHYRGVFKTKVSRFPKYWEMDDHDRKKLIHLFNTMSPYLRA